MRLRGYYRQFEGMTDEEVSQQHREQADERRRNQIVRVETLDLSRTTWHELPHPDVLAAITFASRGPLNDPPDPSAEELRRALGRRNGISPERIAVGHGAANLLAAAAQALLGPDDELLIPWPSYGLYPVMAQRAGARAVPFAGGHDVEALLAAVTPRTRAIALCNPNDPTGAHLPIAALSALLDGLPEEVTLLLDEALADFVATEQPGVSAALLERHPRLLIFRTFSKVYGLAGMRCGYVLGGPGSESLLSRIAPELGVGVAVQAGALEALIACGPLVARRRASVITERGRLVDALHDLPVDAAPSEANVLWLRTGELPATELAERLLHAGVRVFDGATVGDRHHVRVTIQGAAANLRLLDALRAVTIGGDAEGDDGADTASAGASGASADA